MIESRGRLRKSDLAGWRTKSLLPRNRFVKDSFIPVIKLRGLPYFCTKKHIINWFGSLAAGILKLIIIPEMDLENSGFAIVIMNSSSAAIAAWEKLHKKCITPKRFVEVFCLLPPFCPLTKRLSNKLMTDRFEDINDKKISEPTKNSKKITCQFCFQPFNAHNDGGSASLNAQFNLSDNFSLMSLSYLNIPALIYNDPEFSQDIERFLPEEYQTCSQFKQRFPERLIKIISIGDHKYIDLNDVEGYDIKHLLAEIIKTIQVLGTLTLSELGNNLSALARSYLFLTEHKLQSTIEKYSNLFGFTRANQGIIIWLKRKIDITNLNSYICGHRMQKGNRINKLKDRDGSYSRKKKIIEDQEYRQKEKEENKENVSINIILANSIDRIKKMEYLEEKELDDQLGGILSDILQGLNGNDVLLDNWDSSFIGKTYTTPLSAMTSPGSDLPTEI